MAILMSDEVEKQNKTKNQRQRTLQSNDKRVNTPRTAILYVCATNKRASKHMKQKPPILVEDFNTPLTTINRTTR